MIRTQISLTKPEYEAAKRKAARLCGFKRCRLGEEALATVESQSSIRADDHEIAYRKARS